MKKVRYSKKVTIDKEKFEMSLDKLIELVKIPHSERTNSDIRIMQRYFCQNMDYFKKLSKEPDGNEKIQKLISVVNYEYFNKDEYILKFGEMGDKFYIILSGTVGIYKPYPKNMDMTLHDYVDYLVRIRDWEQNPIKFERVQNYNSNIDRIRLLIINYNSSKLPYSTKKLPIVVEEERFLLKLGPGNSFGEMALIKNETRNANIIAHEKCQLISIDKIDYRKIMKDMEEQKINSQLKSFKLDYPFFKEWPANRCIRLLSSFVTDNLSKDDYVYKQNNLANYIYIIKKGEFEVTSDINFSWYEDFINYIHDTSESLINDMDNPLLWKEDNLQKKINKANEINKCPCILSLPPISKIILSHRIDGNNYDNDNNIKNSENTEINFLKEVTKEENNINMQNKIIRRINIEKLEAPQIFGFIEPFELKRRFCNIRCLSREGVVQKIPFVEFLQLLPKDKKNRFFLEKYIYNRKRELIEQLKNGTIAKLSFHYHKLNIKSNRVYPGRNMDKIQKKKPKILIRSISMIRLNQNEKLKKNLSNINNEIILNNTNNLKYFPIKVKVNKDINTELKKPFIAFTKKKVNSAVDISPLGLLSEKSKRSFSVRKNNNKKSVNNSSSSMKYVDDNNISTVLPTKSTLRPIYDSTGKNYINSSSKQVINKVFFKNNINDFSHISKINKNNESSLPNIDNKDVENYSCKNLKFQDNEIIKIKKRVSKNLLNNNDYKFFYS